MFVQKLSWSCYLQTLSPTLFVITIQQTWIDLESSVVFVLFQSASKHWVPALFGDNFGYPSLWKRFPCSEQRNDRLLPTARTSALHLNACMCLPEVGGVHKAKWGMLKRSTYSSGIMKYHEISWNIMKYQYHEISWNIMKSWNVMKYVSRCRRISYNPALKNVRTSARDGFET